jgi:hypothetical protein
LLGGLQAESLSAANSGIDVGADHSLKVPGVLARLSAP